MMQAAVLQQQRMQMMRQEADGAQASVIGGQSKSLEGHGARAGQMVSFSGN